MKNNNQLINKGSMAKENKKIKDKGNGLYDVQVAETMEDIDGNNVSVLVTKHSNMTLEQMEYHRDFHKDRFDEWEDLINQVNIPE